MAWRQYGQGIFTPLITKDPPLDLYNSRSPNLIWNLPLKNILLLKQTHTTNLGGFTQSDSNSESSTTNRYVMSEVGRAIYMFRLFLQLYL